MAVFHARKAYILLGGREGACRANGHTGRRNPILMQVEIGTRRTFFAKVGATALPA